ncbi:MAG: hypothetical protein O3B02_06835 [Proteobacteria bacterium]|jgi:hypothetical protein|nr:hypothetical protein [Pseudomonadota bacterium]MDA1244703.1 hypothetical protein [Pseudomonadota bacterium]
MVKNQRKNTVLSHRHELYITGYKIFHGLDLHQAEREFIGRALCMIGKGHDPGEALQSKAKRGEKVGTQAARIENRNRLVVSLIKTLRKSQDKRTGKKMTIEAVINFLASDDGRLNDGEFSFKLTENNLRKIWKEYKDSPDFEEDFYQLPID